MEVLFGIIVGLFDVILNIIIFIIKAVIYIVYFIPMIFARLLDWIGVFPTMWPF